MKATELLEAAMTTGRLVRGADVSATTHPDAARTYLADGTGLAWHVAPDLRAHGRFVVDAEIIAPVRPSLQRRYSITDDTTFAEAWTRVEVWAKLLDTPVITWLTRHGLDEPTHIAERRDVGEIAWTTRRYGDAVAAFGVSITQDFHADPQTNANETP